MNVVVASASAAACSTSTGATSCTINATLTVSAGTLNLEASPNLYWDFVGTGYDQWASGSATSLSSCAASGATTTCGGGTKPVLLALDAAGSGQGWAISEYLTGSLPTGAVLHFNGAGSATVGNSSASPIATDPFSSTTPSNICDYGSGCTVATVAGTCSHIGIGFTTCPSYAVTVGGADATHQVDLYSAASGTGQGAVCFASGAATGTGCAGATPTDFYNLGVKGNTPAATSTPTINMAITSGP